jgi:hypothetical protein
VNTQTGDTFVYFDEKTRKANTGVPLTLQEQQELGALPNTQERLRRYKQMHADDRCQKCALRLREHTLKEWQYCQWVLSGESLQGEVGK